METLRQGNEVRFIGQEGECWLNPGEIYIVREVEPNPYNHPEFGIKLLGKSCTFLTKFTADRFEIIKTAMPAPSYELIPMCAISDEARELAVKWVHGLAKEPYAVWNAHKLASDIMNFSEGANKDLNTKIASLNSTVKIMDTNNIAMREAIQKFCDRVDKGEIRSKKTYAEFKLILLKHDNF